MRCCLAAMMLLATVLISAQSCGQEIEENQTLSETLLGDGMRQVKINDATLIVPEGSRIYKSGNLYTTESTEAFTTRRLMEVEKRISDLEVENKDLKSRLGAIMIILEDIKRGQPVKEAAVNE